MNALALRDWPTTRQWIQVVLLAVLGALVSYRIIDNDTAQVVTVFVAAVLPPALSIFNSASGVRTWFYGAVLAAQALLIGLHVWTDAQISPVVNIIIALISVGVSVTHTPTPLAAEPPPT